MTAQRTLLCLLFAPAAALWQPASAQMLPGAPATASNTVSPPASPPRGVWLPGGRSYLGLNLGRSRSGVACSSIALTCSDTERPAQFYAGTMLGNFWGVEMAYLPPGSGARAGGDMRPPGLALSLVAKTQLAPSVGVFGKFGTNYARNAPPSLAATRAASGSYRGFGLSFGAGLSFDFTPALSATLEWDSTDVPVMGGRDPVRSTSLGLKYRY